MRCSAPHLVVARKRPIEVAPRAHRLQARIDRTGSAPADVSVADDETVSFAVEPDFDRSLRGLTAMLGRQDYLRLTRLREPPGA